uniref:Uncharacterized protein n=1 Tax=Heterorhabditis bacteriophora TaxID=37862 RepID=A0A1I7X064_HETBA
MSREASTLSQSGSEKRDKSSESVLSRVKKMEEVDLTVKKLFLQHIYIYMIRLRDINGQATVERAAATREAEVLRMENIELIRAAELRKQNSESMNIRNSIIVFPSKIFLYCLKFFVLLLCINTFTACTVRYGLYFSQQF